MDKTKSCFGFTTLIRVAIFSVLAQNSACSRNDSVRFMPKQPSIYDAASAVVIALEWSRLYTSRMPLDKIMASTSLLDQIKKDSYNVERGLKHVKRVRIRCQI